MATRRLRGKRVLTKKALEFEGIPELQAQATKLIKRLGYQGGDVAHEAKRAFMAGGLIVRDEARSLVHKVSGKLQEAIFAAYGDEKKADVLVGVNTRIPVTTYGGKTRTYAAVVEYGDSTHPPNPYMRPAITATRPVVGRIVSDELRNAIVKLNDKL